MDQRGLGARSCREIVFHTRQTHSDWTKFEDRSSLGQSPECLPFGLKAFIQDVDATPTVNQDPGDPIAADVHCNDQGVV